MKPKAILIDIDGTLANVDHRRHFVDPFYDKSLNIPCYGEGGLCDGDVVCTKCMQKCLDFKKDFQSFNEAMQDDTPNEWCVELIKSMCNEGYFILFVSGREEKYRMLTGLQINAWTNVIKKDSACKLFMRPTYRTDIIGLSNPPSLLRDFRPDVEVKREIYEQHIKDKYEVVFCVDDNAEIVKLWRSLGLVCLDCAGYER